MAGRHRKYTAKALDEAVNRYFRSISRQVQAKDLTGQVILDMDDQPIWLTQYVKPPDIAALCLYLQIDEKTWNNYSKRKDMEHICADAKLRCKAWLQEQLVTREKGLNGIIFNLTANYGLKQRQEVGLDEETRKDLKTARSMTLEEKLALITQAAKDFPSEEAEDDGEEEDTGA